MNSAREVEKDELVNLRRYLHAHPELSGKEENTLNYIKEYLSKNTGPNRIERVGEESLIVTYDFGEGGATIVIRCELDALPIQEVNKFPYRSIHQGVSHKCGLDGHMSIVVGVGLALEELSLKNGKVVLLFQSAEETGQGASKVVNDPNFRELNPDYVFALHNIPGEKKGSIISLEKTFAAAVESIAITIDGQKTHAAQPEGGINPSFAIAELIDRFKSIEENDPHDSTFCLLTPVHLKVGNKNYGIAPGSGELHYTIRAWSDEKLSQVKKLVQKILEDINSTHGVKISYEWLEYFPSNENNSECNDFIKNAAIKNQYPIIERPFPFRFGEDFGWFSKEYPCGMFGLGAGMNTPALHQEDYDFPDEILIVGVKMFCGIIQQALAEHNQEINE